MSYSRFDVILVLFPFSERKGTKQRPAIVLSGNGFNAAHRHSIVAMVTTASLSKWPSDIPIRDFGKAGLVSPCVVRAKVFTISDDLVIGRVGTLVPEDASGIGIWIAGLLDDSNRLQAG